MGALQGQGMEQKEQGMEQKEYFWVAPLKPFPPRWQTSFWKEETNPSSLVKPLLSGSFLPPGKFIFVPALSSPVLVPQPALGMFLHHFLPSELEKSREYSSSCHSPQPKPGWEVTFP